MSGSSISLRFFSVPCRVAFIVLPSILMVSLAHAMPHRPASADRDVAAANAYYESGQLGQARTSYRRAARRGEPIAEFNLASMLMNGEGGGTNAHEALYWLRLSADAGVPPAQYALGLLYDSGKGVERSQVIAAHWYRRAAEQGEADAELALATLYFVGRNGIAQDYAEAAKWYELAARAGLEPAQYIIASCYEHGDGVEQDTERAVYWYLEAARNGDTVAADKARVLTQAVQHGQNQ